MTTQNYDAAGFLQDTTDPRNLTTHRANDALGRVVVETDHYDPQAAASPDTNKATHYLYNALDQVTQALVNVNLPSGGAGIQTTEYAYGNSNAFDAGRLSAVRYPDPATGKPTIAGAVKGVRSGQRCQSGAVKGVRNQMFAVVLPWW